MEIINYFQYLRINLTCLKKKNYFNRCFYSKLNDELTTYIMYGLYGNEKKISLKSKIKNNTKKVTNDQLLLYIKNIQYNHNYKAVMSK